MEHSVGRLERGGWVEAGEFVSLPEAEFPNAVP